MRSTTRPLTDVEVCYKMFTREVKDSLRITCDDFGYDVQISAQISLARRWRIYELGIRYFGPTYEEGKQIGWQNGLKNAVVFAAISFRSVRDRSGWTSKLSRSPFVASP